jgi:hypothetical protein
MLRRIRRTSTVALILSPVGVLLVAATRVLIVSDYNLSTALAILSSSGYVNTLVGSVIPLVPILMPYIALVLLYFDRVVAALLAFAATLLISPATVAGTSAISLLGRDWALMTGGSGIRHAVLIILAIPLSGLLLIEIVGFRMTTVIKTVGTVGIIVTLPLIVRLYPIPVSNSFYENVLSQPWLPAETITLATHQVVTGYVLDSDDNWFEVLLSQDRTVAEYHTNKVISRTMCQTASAEAKRPLIPLVPAVSRLPACPQPTPSAGTRAPVVGRGDITIFGTPVVPFPPLLPLQSSPASRGVTDASLWCARSGLEVSGC